MKAALLILSSVFILSGCKDDSSIVYSAPPYSNVIVTFSTGFRGDSTILISDNRIVAQGRGFSDSVGVSGGWNLVVATGQHVFELQLPEMDISAKTPYPVSAGVSTRIDAHFNRVERKISYEIYFYKY